MYAVVCSLLSHHSHVFRGSDRSAEVLRVIRHVVRGAQLCKLIFDWPDIYRKRFESPAP